MLRPEADGDFVGGACAHFRQRDQRRERVPHDSDCRVSPLGMADKSKQVVPQAIGRSRHGNKWRLWGSSEVQPIAEVGNRKVTDRTALLPFEGEALRPDRNQFVRDFQARQVLPVFPQSSPRGCAP